jgi:hypothetical protein
MNETEFTPRCLSGAAELEIDFYRDLYELGVWWALLSSYDRETRARRVLERSLYNVEGFREAFDREAAKGGEFFDIIDRILHKADKACKEWSKSTRKPSAIGRPHEQAHQKGAHSDLQEAPRVSRLV